MTAYTHTVEMLLGNEILACDGTILYTPGGSAILNPNSWADVTPDVLRRKPITAQRGMGGSSPMDRVAAPGRLNFVLDNGESNAAATLSAGAGYTWSVPTFTSANLCQRPCYETRWLTWEPQHSTTGGAYTNLPTVNTADYMLSGRTAILDERHTQHGTPGGSGYQQFTLPISAKYVFAPGGNCANESTANMFLAFFSTTALMRLFKYDGSAQITASQVYHTNGVYPYV